MAGAHDDHDGPIHQAPWVAPTTVIICLSFVMVFMLARFLVGADISI